MQKQIFFVWCPMEGETADTASREPRQASSKEEAAYAWLQDRMLSSSVLMQAERLYQLQYGILVWVAQEGGERDLVRLETSVAA